MAFPLPVPNLFEISKPPQLPPYCSPTTPFLTNISSVFHTCIPTPLALVSTLLGCLSILSWLFAQLPQIFKNHKLKSTSGLSIYFLIEWCLGDMSNLSGAVLTHQASWQIIIGAYYCFVDLALVGQWIWFDALGRGSKVIAVWRQVSRREGAPTPQLAHGSEENMFEVIEDVDTSNADGRFQPRHSPQNIPKSKDDLFRSPNYGSIRSTKEELYSSSSGNGRTLHRVTSNPLPSPSPRTILLISMVLSLASTSVSASPLQHPQLGAITAHASPALSLGTLLSWTSTLLYLVSRLPQLLKNHRRRSTAGLSPLLFLAAFHGNLFYSTSLLLNPNLWYDVPPCGPSDTNIDWCGWTGPSGNDRRKWMLAALPFFLGAAGVLFMDASIGLQFLLWGEPASVTSQEGAELETEQVLLVDAGKTADGQRRWREVSGWMRGWVPTVSGSFSAGVGAVGGLRPTGSLGGAMRRASGRDVRPPEEREDGGTEGTSLLRVAG